MDRAVGARAVRGSRRGRVARRSDRRSPSRRRRARRPGASRRSRSSTSARQCDEHAGERRQIGVAGQIDWMRPRPRQRRATSATRSAIRRRADHHRLPRRPRRARRPARRTPRRPALRADPYAAPGASATSGARPSQPALREQRLAPASRRAGGRVDPRRAGTVRKAQRAHEPLVVVDLVQAGRRARTARVSRKRRASRCDSPTARACPRAYTINAEWNEFGQQQRGARSRRAATVRGPSARRSRPPRA